MVKNKVSIIIPVLNRAHLIAETLNSIQNQAYTNWECIVVDDGSTDDTFQVTQEYARLDPRIRPFKRPGDGQKGANGCRNFGYMKAEGEYIIWFDSDDLMTPDHIESKVKEIEKKDLDFVVARTQNFRDDEMLEPYTYLKKDYGIRAADFILLKIHWYTYDVMLRREVAEKIEWNEQMKSWQDYNYFCKMLLITENGAYLDKILTHRRLHADSIQNKLNRTEDSFRQKMIENRYYTFIDLDKMIEDKTRAELLYGLMNLGYEIKKSGEDSPFIKKIHPLVQKNLGAISLILFKVALLFASKLEKGFFILEKAKKR